MVSTATTDVQFFYLSEPKSMRLLIDFFIV
jgi:hypothetical protein